MKTRELVQKLNEIEGVSETYKIYLKAPGGGQWGELTLRKASEKELIAARIKSERLTVAIAADGDKKLMVKSLVEQLRRLPESSDVYAVVYDKTGEGKLGAISILGLKLLHEGKDSNTVIAIAATELNAP